jgi:cobalt/nickel transport system ATP-binding protein
MVMIADLDVRNLRYRYANGIEALRGVSFTLQPGERVALIGPNGAGKSTLLWHLNGLLLGRGDGEVHIQGQAVTGENLSAVRRKVGLLFEDPNDQLFCPTVFEDVAFGPRQLDLDDAAVRTRVADALNRVGMSGFDDRSPHQLSAGQKRRVCLAGVLACEPAVLVLDEPTQYLDPRGRRDLKALLRDIRITQLIATHDLEMVVELCSRTIVLDDGRIVADGPTRTLLSDVALMEKHNLERPHILMHHHPHGDHEPRSGHDMVER